MTTQERIKDIQETGYFSDNEVSQSSNARPQFADNTFMSYAYHQIMHYTNTELYYLSDEEEETMRELSDLIVDTNKGRIYCFS